MSKRAKATLCISLRNNDALRISLQRADGSGQAGKNVTWSAVQAILKEVMPVAEKKRQAQEIVKLPDSENRFLELLRLHQQWQVRNEAVSAHPMLACRCQSEQRKIEKRHPDPRAPKASMAMHPAQSDVRKVKLLREEFQEKLRTILQRKP